MINSCKIVPRGARKCTAPWRIAEELKDYQMTKHKRKSGRVESSRVESSRVGTCYT